MPLERSELAVVDARARGAGHAFEAFGQVAAAADAGVACAGRARPAVLPAVEAGLGLELPRPAARQLRVVVDRQRRVGVRVRTPFGSMLVRLESASRLASSGLPLMSKVPAIEVRFSSSSRLVREFR